MKVIGALAEANASTKPGSEADKYSIEELRKIET